MLKEMLAYALLTVGKRLKGAARDKVLCAAHAVSPGTIWGTGEQHPLG